MSLQVLETISILKSVQLYEENVNGLKHTIGVVTIVSIRDMDMLHKFSPLDKDLAAMPHLKYASCLLHPGSYGHKRYRGSREDVGRVEGTHHQVVAGLMVRCGEAVYIACSTVFYLCYDAAKYGSFPFYIA